MNLVQNYDGIPEFVRDRDFDMFLFLDRINVLSTEVYYDVLDTGGSIVSTIVTYWYIDTRLRLCRSSIQTDFMNSDFYDKKQFMENRIYECLRGIIKDYIFNDKEYDKLCPYSFKLCSLR